MPSVHATLGSVRAIRAGGSERTARRAVPPGTVEMFPGRPRRSRRTVATLAPGSTGRYANLLGLPGPQPLLLL